MTESEWATYIRRISGGATGREIAQRTGIPEATVSRWLSGSTAPRPRHVLAVARAYDANPLTAYVAAGQLDVDDLGDDTPLPPELQVRKLTLTEITGELHRRAVAGELG